MEGVRLLAAFQVLSLPSGTLGVTHKVAKAHIKEATGKAPRKPPAEAPGWSLEQWLAWHNQ